MYMDHAIGEVMTILAKSHADPLRRRMRLAWRVVGT